MELKLKKFNLDMIDDGDIVVLLGKRNTGKSFLTKDILYHKKHLPVGTVISGTECANGFFSKFVPPIFIYDEYDPLIIRKLWKRQVAAKKKIEAGQKDIDNRTYLVFDDCLADSSEWKNDKLVKRLFMNGRHFAIFFILTMQYPVGIGPQLRNNIDFVFILRENNYAMRKKIYDHYAGVFKTFEFFCDIMDQCTENFECLVINNKAKTNKLEDQVFWYRAEQHDNFKMGSPEVWKLCESMKYNNFNDDFDDDDYSEINNYKKKKTPRINVRKQ